MASFFYCLFSFTCFKKLPLLLRVPDALTLHINSLGKNLTLNLLAYNDVHSMLGDIVDSCGFAVVTLMGHSFLYNARSP